MPRPLRPVAQDLVYHVINRGNNRAPVFHTDGDYAAFLDTLGDLKGRKPFRLFGYCLMSNHFHVLIRPLEVPISRIVQSLLVLPGAVERRDTPIRLKAVELVERDGARVR